MADIKEEMNQIINELEKKGISHDMTEKDLTGLGDVVESVLKQFGITEERFKEFWGLRECNCTKRKKWLNSLFSWYKKR